MNEQEAINWIHKQLKFGIKPGLSRVETLLEKLGEPHKKLKTIHIAGTNGKGSTTTFLREILQQQGFKIGTFTSPYIEIFNERISINGEPIPAQDLIQLVEHVRPICEELATTEDGAPTEFEIITVMSFMYFVEQSVDYAIIEVGLGGRLDSTNVIRPVVSVITTIGYDHIHILGDTLEEITYEKAGIIKPSTPVISGVKQVEAQKIIEKRSKDNQTTVLQLGYDFKNDIANAINGEECFHFEYESMKFVDIKMSMKGYHQIDNASLAIQSYLTLATIERFPIQKEVIYKGIFKAYWPGRFELIQKGPDVILDGAHNVEAIKTLVTTINNRYESKKVTILCSFIQNKPINEMLSILSKNYNNITLTTFDFFNNYGYYELKEKYENGNVKVVEDWKNTYNSTLEALETDEVLVVTGSLYFISEVKQSLKENN
ncbi:dihydrofolate synthase/folylpolyglutamate synthase [Alkalibacillus filiformis]|uniref:tetrahydrofolate synthase n=1 Tax=Alkalibacillus filiformis TaxID=200990 RepID=A0ABU0DRU8_9BACI|nr:folylpolyglutamate synthase/dihydrofolate synthase family protein [Alkalibacillus filiformis]MDQ0351165.1 dihydrofolate synthase/folylpolyglutamate synthase [Alkalibacillus filiformis]